MAFEYNGTFTASQFDRFKTYLTNQLPLITARIKHLEAERDRVGSLSFAYDSAGNPTSYTGDTPDTYCGKLFAAYEALGGDVEFDLQIRSTSQPVFRIAGDAATTSQFMSNGEIIGVLGLNDAPSAVLVQKMRSAVQGDLHRRRDYLERKLRRAIDYAEQLDSEISQLTLFVGAAESEDSFANYLNTINAMINDPRYMAITNDAADPDPHGKFARAPIAAYTPGGKGATAIMHERTLNGLVKPSNG